LIKSVRHSRVGGNPALNFYILLIAVPTITFGSALAGAGTFLLRKKKDTKEIRPITTCPEGQASASNFANASARLAIPLAALNSPSMANCRYQS